MTYYLYQKTHRQTQVSYLGYTKNNPYRYKGSGVRWLKHLKAHGNDVETIILLETDDYNAICQVGKYYSEYYDVVKSKKWANLKPELGDGGGVTGMNKNKKRPLEHIQAMKAGWQRIKAEGYSPWNKGKRGIYRSGKPVIIISPTGQEYQYDRLKDACRELGLQYTHMSSVHTGKKTNWKEWTVKTCFTTGLPSQ